MTQFFLLVSAFVEIYFQNKCAIAVSFLRNVTSLVFLFVIGHVHVYCFITAFIDAPNTFLQNALAKAAAWFSSAQSALCQFWLWLIHPSIYRAVKYKLHARRRQMRSMVRTCFEKLFIRCSLWFRKTKKSWKYIYLFGILFYTLSSQTHMRVYTTLKSQTN